MPKIAKEAANLIGLPLIFRILILGRAMLDFHRADIVDLVREQHNMPHERERCDRARPARQRQRAADSLGVGQQALVLLVQSPEEGVDVFRPLRSVVYVAGQGERAGEQGICIIVRAVVVDRAEVGAQRVGVAATAEEDVVRVGTAKTAEPVLLPQQIFWEDVSGARAVAVVNEVLDDECVRFEIRVEIRRR